MNIFQNYITELQKHKISEITEHSHRTCLQNLLNSFVEEIQQRTTILHEPRRQGKNGSPDFMITVKESIIGYIENKKILQNLDEIIFSEQIEKYKKLSNNLLITNYVEFVWIRDNEISRERLCEVTDIENKNFKLKPENEKNVKELLKKFFTQAPQGIENIEKLAFCLAERAKYLFAILWDELKELEKNVKNQDPIWLAYSDFVNNVYEELTIEGFADTFAQTLTYGLFLAKLNSKNQDAITLRNLDLHISDSFSLIKNIVGFLHYVENKRYSKAQWIIEEILSIINNIDLKSINESLSFSKRKKQSASASPDIVLNNEEYKDPYIYFYENFLSEYNHKLRKGRGVYYTPISVVRFIINSVNSILKDKNLFNIKDGIADYEKVNILDFATGTGTFLLEILEQINEIKPFNKPEGAMLVQNHILKNLYGFEFLIAPYVISHLKLSQFLKETGYELKEEERLQIYLTNTLEDKVPQNSLFLTSLAIESQLAQNVKRNKKILVITGNPPYSGHSSNASEVKFKVSKTLKSGETIFVNKKKDTWIGNLVNDYFKIEGVAINEKNSKWLQDDYVKFIRFAQYKIEQTGQGIVAIVTNHSFLDNPTFNAMRYNLLKTFDQIRIIDLHGNTRKKESTLEGTKDENVFDIQQGVCISLFIKSTNPQGFQKPQGLAQVLRTDFFGLRETKNKLLYETKLSDIEWTELKPTAPHYLFAFQDEKDKENYNKFWSIKDIFKINSVGIVTARDKLAIQFTKNDIREVVNDFAKLDEKTAKEKYKLGDDARDWKVGLAQNDLKKSGLDDNNIIPILYRPFDIRYTYYTGKSRGFHCMPRGEVMKNFLIDRPRFETMKHFFNENIGLISVRQVAEGIFTHAYISNTLTDFRTTLSNKGGSFIFPLYRYESKNLFTKDLKKSTKNLQKDFEKTKRNFDKEWKKYQNAKDIEIIEKQLKEQDINVDNEEFVKIDNFSTEFSNFAKEKYKTKYSPEQILGYIYAILHSPTYRNKYVDFLKIDFPRIPFCENKKDFEELAKIGEELYKLHLKPNEVEETITVNYDGEIEKDVVETVKYQEIENKKRIYINKTNFFENIPEHIFEFQIGGYKVIDKYLKERKGKKLEIQEIKHFKNIVNVLNYTINTMNKIDKFVNNWI